MLFSTTKTEYFVQTQGHLDKGGIYFKNMHVVIPCTSNYPMLKLIETSKQHQCVQQKQVH